MHPSVRPTAHRPVRNAEELRELRLDHPERKLGEHEQLPHVSASRPSHPATGRTPLCVRQGDLGLEMRFEREEAGDEAGSGRFRLEKALGNEGIVLPSWTGRTSASGTPGFSWTS